MTEDVFFNEIFSMTRKNNWRKKEKVLPFFELVCKSFLNFVGCLRFFSFYNTISLSFVQFMKWKLKKKNDTKNVTLLKKPGVKYFV